MRHLRFSLLVVMFVAGCGRGDTPVSPTPEASVFLSFSSTSGDILGRGQSRRFEGGQATFFGAMVDNNRAFQVTVRHDGTFSQLTLRALPGQVLVPGIYRNASRGSDPFLDFAFAGSACNNNSGEFEVLEAVYGPNPSGFAGYSGTINRFRATFRQTCSATPADSITGEVRLVNIPMTG